MRKIKKLNYLIILITTIGGIIIGINSLTSGDLYSGLSKFSIIVVVTLPILIRKKTNLIIKPVTELIYLIFIFFAQFLGSVLNFYDVFNNYDVVVHTLSGFLGSFIALIILVMFDYCNYNKIKFNIIFILAITLSIASLWEIYEYIIDIIFNADTQNSITSGVADTMQDIIAALIGGIIFCILYYYEKTNKNKRIIKYFIKELKNG